MAHEIKVPSFGESITEGTIAPWLKRDGEWVDKGEPLVTIDTEKASSDLEADVGGKLKIAAQAGTDVKIGAIIGQIDESTEKPATKKPANEKEAPAKSQAQEETREEKPDAPKQA